jgi:S1-C subfamily serine protease
MHWNGMLRAIVVTGTLTVVTAHGWTGATPTATSIRVFDDREIYQALEREGLATIENGGATSVAELIEQLQRDRTVLHLDPPVAYAAEELGTVYERARDSVVIVAGLYKCDRCPDWHARPASGFVLRSNGIVVTNHHVIDNSNNEHMVVMCSQGRVFPVVEVLAANVGDDVAIIRCDFGDERLPALNLRANTPVGRNAHVISHPDRQFFLYSRGIVSRYALTTHREIRSPRMFITADYARGSSGAPILNDAAEVIGLVSSTRSIYYTEEDGIQRNLQMVLKLCVPAQAVLDLIETP